MIINKSQYTNCGVIKIIVIDCYYYVKAVIIDGWHGEIDIVVAPVEHRTIAIGRAKTTVIVLTYTYSAIRIIIIK